MLGPPRRLACGCAADPFCRLRKKRRSGAGAGEGVAVALAYSVEPPAGDTPAPASAGGGGGGGAGGEVSQPADRPCCFESRTGGWFLGSLVSALWHSFVDSRWYPKFFNAVLVLLGHIASHR
ncbi:Protein of unknown function [Gryllus bimaculatus]|nr:Protein of unknown function [Gryllus bimaculatus]